MLQHLTMIVFFTMSFLRMRGRKRQTQSSLWHVLVNQISLKIAMWCSASPLENPVAACFAWPGHAALAGCCYWWPMRMYAAASMSCILTLVLLLLASSVSLKRYYLFPRLVRFGRASCSQSCLSGLYLMEIRPSGAFQIWQNLMSPTHTTCLRKENEWTVVSGYWSFSEQFCCLNLLCRFGGWWLSLRSFGWWRDDAYSSFWILL